MASHLGLHQALSEPEISRASRHRMPQGRPVQRPSDYGALQFLQIAARRRSPRNKDQQHTLKADPDLVFYLPGSSRIADGLEGVGAFDGLADVVAGCPVFVLGAGWLSGADTSGLGNTGQAGKAGADVPESTADPGRGEPAGGGGFLPGPAEVHDEGPGEPELGVSDDQEPGPAVRRLRGTEFRGGSAGGLLREAEDVLQIGAAEECLPETVHITGGGAGLRRP